MEGQEILMGNKTNIRLSIKKSTFYTCFDIRFLILRRQLSFQLFLFYFYIAIECIIFIGSCFQKGSSELKPEQTYWLPQESVVFKVLPNWVLHPMGMISPTRLLPCPRHLLRLCSHLRSETGKGKDRVFTRVVAIRITKINQSKERTKTMGSGAKRTSPSILLENRSNEACEDTLTQLPSF